jgi:Protein of unknown function (DUF1559)
MRFVPFVALALALVGVVHSDGAGSVAEARAKFIAPYLDNNTFIVASFDLTKPDADEAAITLWAFADPVLGVKRTFMASETRDLFGLLRKHGAREVYALYNFAGPAFSQDFVVSTSSQADSKTIMDLLSPGGRFLNIHSAQVGSAVVFGSKEACERYRKMTAQPRPELVKAFTDAGDATAQICLVLSPEARRALEEIIPEVPPEVGGGSTSLLTRGVQWVAIGLNGPPKSTMRAIVQAADEHSANKIKDWLQAALKALAQHPQTKANWKDLAPAFSLNISGDKLVVTLDKDRFTKFVQPLVAKNLATEDREAVSAKLLAIGRAMHLHHDSTRAFPLPASQDKEGKALLSWRVHLLPYLQLEKLYVEFKLDEPWDSVHNKKLIARIPTVYKHPFGVGVAEGKTPFLVPIGQSTMFPGGKGMRMPQDVPDGTSNTVLVFQAADDNMVIWTKPEDWQFDPKQPHRGLVDKNRPSFQAVFADAAVHVLKNSISDETLRAVITRNGGEVVGKDLDDQR